MITSKFFNMGQIVVTKSINDLMAAEQKFAVEVTVALQRYAVKDWGNLDDEDKQTNEEALNYPDDLYVMGVYETSKGKIWIITNRISEKVGDNATTVCFPDER
ncbi:hypothetical protein KQI69_04285 [Eubacterium sp. MSJ-13]|uniref:hypothetical protein n=1 Tax=Eubacterium sp. MSJ-13 TaxID=2841513 RepID=UPI001C1133B2|nr:hypothetical protein [Eubacterium sp. MSJ-13]MBU5478419.1 hypothetical protein [Eubacterium sp. MSJ-13]